MSDRAGAETGVGDAEATETSTALASSAAVGLGLPAIGAACAGCAGTAIGAAILVPGSGVEGWWRLVVVAGITGFVAAINTRNRIDLSRISRAGRVARVGLSGALTYVAVAGIVAIVSVVLSGGASGPQLP